MAKLSESKLSMWRVHGRFSSRWQNYSTEKNGQKRKLIPAYFQRGKGYFTPIFSPPSTQVSAAKITHKPERLLAAYDKRTGTS